MPWNWTTQRKYYNSVGHKDDLNRNKFSSYVSIKSIQIETSQSTLKDQMTSLMNSASHFRKKIIF